MQFSLFFWSEFLTSTVHIVRVQLKLFPFILPKNNDVCVSPVICKLKNGNDIRFTNLNATCKLAKFANHNNVKNYIIRINWILINNTLSLRQAICKQWVYCIFEWLFTICWVFLLLLTQIKMQPWSMKHHAMYFLHVYVIRRWSNLLKTGYMLLTKSIRCLLLFNKKLHQIRNVYCEAEPYFFHLLYF